MIDECQNEIEKIENDVTFSNPENLDNLDKDNETSVVNKQYTMQSYVQTFITVKEKQTEKNGDTQKTNRIEFFKKIKTLISDHGDGQFEGTNNNIIKIKNSIVVADQKLSEFKSQIDGIISNIINERQANIQRKDYDEVKEDHGSKVDLEAFNIESKREYYSKKLQDLIEFRQYMED